METIDISDLDIKIILKELWDNTITAAFFIFNPHVPIPEYEEPKSYNRYFDYYCGRPIKTDLTDLHEVYYKGYDRNAGNGKFLEIVSKLRNN